ncbi:hypothetical protein [uncultured Clostridium sp.]|uniref:hypothetical protein n=1 Tax=uncultured Clostridium sp. TaxID=59620 RepID=UPI00260F7CF7|nr:hypothetical protein [uncultured Clostridium sp.]
MNKLDFDTIARNMFGANADKYKEYDGYKVYEFKAYTEPEMNFLKEALKSI